ncbi:hypothetical protein Tco_0500988 [Tanacetum coccineum]
MSNPKFAETHNLVVFLEKPEESDGFEGFIDFLNASFIRYALTVNPTIYTTCIEQFWSTAKVKAVNGQRQIQALVDKKKVIITETSIRSDLKLEDAEGTNCLTTATIFVELERTGYENLTQKLTFSKAYFSSQWKFLIHTILQCLSVKTTSWNEFSSTMASAIIFEGMTKHKGIYVTPSYTKKVFANMKRPGNGFSGKVTPLFKTMMVQAPEDMGEDSVAPTDSHSTPIITQPSSSKPQKKYLQEKVLDLEKAKTAQAKEIASLKKRVKKLEKRKKSRTSGLKRLRKVGSTSRVESSNDVKRNDEEMLFDVQDDLQGEEVVAEKEVAEKEVSAADPVTTTGEVVTTANVEVTTTSAPTTTINELTLAQTVIEIKAAKPKAVTTATTTTITTRPKARGVVVQEPSEFKTTSSPSQASQLPQAKDKGKAIMVEPEKPLKKKDQIALDEEVARNLEA